MTMQPENHERNVWADRLRALGSVTLHAMQHMGYAMGAGFAQANQGEMGMRMRGITAPLPANESQRIAEENIQIKVDLFAKSLPDVYIPEEWERYD